MTNKEIVSSIVSSAFEESDSLSPKPKLDISDAQITFKDKSGLRNSFMTDDEGVSDLNDLNSILGKNSTT